MRSAIVNENNYVIKEKKREKLFLYNNKERIGIIFYFCQSRFTENLENRTQSYVHYYFAVFPHVS